MLGVGRGGSGLSMACSLAGYAGLFGGDQRCQMATRHESRLVGLVDVRPQGDDVGRASHIALNRLDHQAIILERMAYGAHPEVRDPFLVMEIAMGHPVEIMRRGLGFRRPQVERSEESTRLNSSH